jgi:hypothetical protein
MSTILTGLLSSGASVLFWMSLFNLFFGSFGILNVQLYLGLIVFSFYGKLTPDIVTQSLTWICAFQVIYDTQIIVEKIKYGNTDYVDHSAELFGNLDKSLN